MSHTQKLYYEDAYKTEFSAEVLEVKRGDIGPYEIILNKTAFFPESGGQPGDKGVLAGGVVLDVQINDEVISHFVSFTGTGIHPPTPGDTVEGRVDFDFRFSNMQQHTGEHIFSGLVKSQFGYENVGFHLSENTVTMDYDGVFSQAQIEALEEATNNIIMMDVPVTSFFPSPEQLVNLDFRAKLDASQMGQVRLVEIYKTDLCACCAPHVNSTGQVGILKVIDHINYKGGTRFTILCGNRAFRDYKEKHFSLVGLSRYLSVPITEIPDAVGRLSTDLNTLRDNVRALEQIILDNALEKANDGVVFTDIGNQILLRNAANTLMETNDSPVFIFNGSDTKGYNLIIASPDAILILNRLKKALDLKGGGKNPMVQGSCKNTRSEIERAIGESL